MVKVVPPITGSRELYTIIDIINNEDKYKAALEKLETERLEVNKSYENQYKASEIDAFHSQAESLREQAKVTLDQAEKKAHEITEIALKTKDEALNEAAKVKAEIAEKEKKFNEEIALLRGELSSKEEQLQLKTESLNKLSDELHQKEQAVEKLRQEYETKIGKLESAIKDAK